MVISKKKIVVSPHNFLIRSKISSINSFVGTFFLSPTEEHNLSLAESALFLSHCYFRHHFSHLLPRIIHIHSGSIIKLKCLRNCILH